MDKPYLESRIAKALGVSSATLRAVRKEALAGGECGLVEMDGRKRMAYTEAGAAKVVGRIVSGTAGGSRLQKSFRGVSVVDVLAVALAGAPAAEKRGGGIPRTVLRVSHPTLNRKIVMATLPDDFIEAHGDHYYALLYPRLTDRERAKVPHRFVDEMLVRVRVGNNANLIKGMELTCEWVQHDLWEFTGRLPRWRGRW